MKPKIIKGGQFSDHRGTLSFNNDFDASQVKRIYCIENKDLEFQRGWQGHRIEQRWFLSVKGKFKIDLIRVDNWEAPSKDLKIKTCSISAEPMEILHVPAGYLTCLKALENHSKLLVMADFPNDISNDEYRIDLNYFERTEVENLP